MKTYHSRKKRDANWSQNKDAILNLALPDIPYKTKKQTLVQEGGAFIEDLLTPVLSSLGFLML